MEKLLTEKKKEEPSTRTVLPMASGGCPSSRMMQSFGPTAAGAGSGVPAATGAPAESALNHWPVQIMLVPPTAPFLKGADLLVLADCVPVAFPTLHRDFLKGKAVMMGCPKFDNTEAYIEKFAQIARHSGIRSITAVVMEVPCCAALPVIVQKGLKLAGATIPMEEVVISVRGKILERRQVQAA